MLCFLGNRGVKPAWDNWLDRVKGWRTGLVACLVALVFACVGHEHEHEGEHEERESEREPASMSAPAPAPTPAPRPLSKWLPDEDDVRVHELALRGRLWIHPLGRRAEFVTEVGETLQLDALTREHVALHGQVARVEGYVWRCGDWRLRPTRLEPLQRPPPDDVARADANPPTPAAPAVDSGAGFDAVVAPWAQVTGRIAGFWQEGFADGAYLRLEDGVRLKLRDLATEPLRRVLRGDLVTVTVELDALTRRATGDYRYARREVPIVGVCLGAAPRCAADDVSLAPAPRRDRPKPCARTSHPISVRQAMRDFGVGEPRRRPMPAFACQQPQKRPRAECRT